MENYPIENDIKDITDLPGYQICRDGIIKNKRTGYILTQTVCSKGYHRIRISGINKLVHRLVYEHFGDFPDDLPNYQIDHIDRNKSNNHISNLRLATTTQNNANKGKRVNTTSDYIGVVWRLDLLKWQSKICVKGKYWHLGYYNHAENGAYVYDLVAKEFKEQAFYSNESVLDLILPDETENRDQIALSAIQKIHNT